MFTLPKLDYSYDALEPFIDAETMEIHYTKHHQTYIDKLNKIVEENPHLKNKTLEELVLLPETKNMAGGHSNHSFLWQTIGPKSDETMPKEIADLKEEFDTKATALFGSGWVWIVKSDKKLEIIQTPLQDSPLISGKKPVLGIDLWEHSYYLKFQNRRPEYIEAFWNVINWKRVKDLLS
jgi:superoxide dismutase, Fe-Mn family